MVFTFKHFKKISRCFFPPTCFLCKHPSDRPQDLCSGCLAELPILPQSCSRCAKTLSAFNHTGIICKTCLKEPPPFDATFALFSYKNPITKLVMELKFHERLLNAQILGELMADAIQTRWYLKRRLPDLIIPVPLHPKRLQERGYNQALEIARPIAKTLAIPIDFTHCKRIKYTMPQARLSGSERQENIADAFEIKGNFSDLSLAVLDDVTTTGYTITALCQAIKSAGAKRIDVWCCAKTLI